MGEKELIAKLKKQEEEAYIELVGLYGDRLLRTLYLMLGDEKEAEDIVQETFIRVFKYINKFRAKSSLYTWIYRISQNILKDRYKLQANLSLEDREQSPLNVEEIIIGQIDREILRQELDNLQFIYKQVIILFYFEDLSIREISKILEEKEGTVKSKLSRARGLLKKALEEGGQFNG